jgi:hypothetical protein
VSYLLFCFAGFDDEEEDYTTMARTPRTPPRNTKASRPSAARKPKGSSSKRAPTRKVDVYGDDEVEDEAEANLPSGQWFFYKDGEEAYADRVIPVCCQRGEGHLNDPVDYIAKLDKGVRMKHEGGTYKKHSFVFI